MSMSFNYTSAFPKLVMLGNSNVGKSSIIKFLLGNRKDTVGIVGKRPGSTQNLRVYVHYNPFFEIIDLPGFGMMKTVPKKVKERIMDGIISFMERERSTVFLAPVVINAVRLGVELEKWFYKNRETIPLSVEFIQWLREINVRTLIVINKIDRLRKSELDRLNRNFIEILTEFGIKPEGVPEDPSDILIGGPLHVSAKTGKNMGMLKDFILSVYYSQYPDGYIPPLNDVVSRSTPGKKRRTPPRKKSRRPGKRK